MKHARTVAGTDAHLPEPIIQAIHRLVSRIRLLLLIRGLLVGCAVGVAVLLALMGLDAVVSVPRLLRGLLTLAGFAVFGCALYRFLFRPLSRTYSAAGVARMVEEHHPEFHERLSSAVELLASPDDASVRGSDELIAELVKAATLDVRDVRPEHEFNLRALARYVRPAAGACIVLAALFVAWPRPMQRLLVRNAVPFAQVGNLEALGLSVTPGDADWPAGEPLTVSAVMAAEGAKMELQIPGRRGSETTMPMEPAAAPAGETRCTYTFPTVSAPLQYRILCGDAVSRVFTVVPHPRPAIQTLDLHYALPAYTGAEPVDVTDADGAITALSGTTVSIKAAFNKDLQSAQLRIESAGPVEVQTELAGDTCTWTFQLPPGTGGTWRAELADRWGIRNLPQTYPLRGEPDGAPQVRIVQPVARRLTVKPGDRVLIRYATRDDVGIARVSLTARIAGGAAVTVPVTLPRPNPDGWQVGEALLDLDRADLSAARQLDVSLRVEDSLPADAGGPQVATTDPITFVVDTRAADFVRQRLDEMARMIRADIDGILAILRPAQASLRGIDAQARVAGALPEAVRARLAAFGKSAAQGGTAIVTLARKLRETDFASISGSLIMIAADPLDAAIASARLVELQDDADKRSEAAVKAYAQTGQAISDLEKLKSTVEDLARRLQIALQLREIAEKEAELAFEAAALERDADIDAEWRRQQQQLLKELEALQQEITEEAPSEREDMQHRAGKLSEDVNRLAFEQDQLTDLAAAARGTGTNDPASTEKLRESIIKILESRQRHLVRRAKRLAAWIEAARQPQAGTVREAAAAGTLAADELGAQQPDSAVEHADQAAEILIRTAAERTTEQEAWVGMLGVEQSEIADLIRTLQNAPIEDMLQQMQESIRRRAEEQARRARELREKAEEADRRSADKASENLDRAAEQAEKAKAELGGQRRPSPNSPGGAGDKGGMAPEPLPGNRSGPKMNEKPTHTHPMETEGTPEASDQSQGGPPQSMNDAAEALRQADEALKEISGLSELERQMDEARQDAENAADAAEPQDAESAAQDAADAALDASSQLGPAPPPGGRRRAQRGSWRVGAAPMGLGISDDEWLRLPGRLQEQILADRRAKTPEEYRALVRRYLREVARLGGEQDTEDR